MRDKREKRREKREEDRWLFPRLGKSELLKKFLIEILTKV